MLLTPDQLYEIQKIIAEHHSAFMVNTIGPEVVPEEVLKKLRAKGLVKESLNTIGESYTYGQLLGTRETEQVAHMSYSAFKNHVRNNPVPLTELERGAMQMAAQNAGQYTRGLGNRVDVATGAILIEADRMLRARMEGDIRTATEENIAKRETIAQLKSDLGWATKDWARDLKRIAVTEKVTAMNQGTSDHFKKRYGADTLVAKRAMPDACQHCSRIYNGPSGPRVFKLSTLEANGTNVGRKAMDWKAVVGSTHPNCFTGETRVVTSRGEIAIKEVRPGDYVYTHQSRWRKVTNVWETLHKGFVTCVENDKEVITRSTFNHPYKVGESWRAAVSLNPGDNLMHLSRDSVDVLLSHPNSEKLPSSISENRFFGSILTGFTRRGVPVTTVYFNGNFYTWEGQIDINRMKSQVVDRQITETHETFVNQAFVGGFKLTSEGLLFSNGSTDQLFYRDFHPSSSFIGFLCESFPLFGTSVLVSQWVSILPTSLDASAFSDTADYRCTGDAKVESYFLNSHQLIEVHVQDCIGVKGESFHEIVPFRSSPIANVFIERFAGVVYNLTVEEDNSYLANGNVVHNCQCIMIRVPAGWGWDEFGDLVPGGEVDMYESPEELALAMLQEDDLQKAFKLQGHVTFQGIPIAIENKEGSVRKWGDLQGEHGETKMQGVSYGYAQGTLSMDEEEIDVFVGPDPRAGMVFIIEQQNPGTGLYDEQKCMLGFPNKDTAERAYRLHYDKPDNFILTIEPMEVEQFKRWIEITKPKKGELMKAQDDSSKFEEDHFDETKLIVLIPERLEKAAAKGGKDIGRVPYTDKGGEKRHKYYYRESAPVRTPVKKKDLEKGIAPEIGAQTSRAGNRAPGPGLGVNYVIPIPDRDNQGKNKHGYFPGREELLREKESEEEEGALHVDKEVYDFTEMLLNVHPYEYPEEYTEAHEGAREGTEERGKYVKDERIINAPRPKNKVVRTPIKKTS